MSGRLVVGPFNRVEGDLEVQLQTSQGVVESARVSSPLYRGFERMLVGKPAMDALVYAPRICGICSVSQSVAAAKALAGLGPLEMPSAGQIAINLILAAENLADHFTHFYVFFMPDFARAVYADEPWHAEIAARFTAIKGAAAREALQARAEWMEIMGILAGKWPHSLAIQPGGSTRAISRTEKVRLTSHVSRFRAFLESTLFGDRLEAVAALDSAEALWAWADRAEASDFVRFLRVSRALGLAQMGRSTTAHMSYGAYAFGADHLFPRGVYNNGTVTALDTDTIIEDVTNAWYRGDGGFEGPASDAPPPEFDEEQGYTWCKAPRLEGQPIEVGALSRQLISGHPLIRDLARDGGNVEARVVARMLELAIVIPQMQKWLSDLDPLAPFVEREPLPQAGSAIGLTEAARGSLGHWLRVRDGQIDHYQIVAPTTWNFSPRDAGGAPGPLEQALVGTPVREGETDPVAVQHVVRSFDPCMVCTVH